MNKQALRREAQKIMKEWEEDMEGFFMEVWSKKTGYKWGDEEYTYIHDLVTDKKI